MEIIIKPVLTEKMTALTDKQHKVAFIVAEGANKIEIKKAVEAMYGVSEMCIRDRSSLFSHYSFFKLSCGHFYNF